MAIFGKKKDAAPADHAPGSVDDRLDALGKTIEGLGKTMEAVVRQNQRLSGVVTSMTAGPPKATTGAPAAGAKLDVSGLPDPNLDPDGYAEALWKRMDDAVAARLAAVDKARADSAAATDERKAFFQDLSDDFDTRYPDLVDAGDDDVAKAEAVKAASTKVIRRLQRRGLDPERHIATDPDGFMEQVAELARAQLTPAEKKGDEEEKAEGGTGPEAHMMDLPDPGRAMVMGGDAARGGSAPAAKKGNSADTSLQGMLLAEQRRARLV